MEKTKNVISSMLFGLPERSQTKILTIKLLFTRIMGLEIINDQLSMRSSETLLKQIPHVTLDVKFCM